MKKELDNLRGQKKEEKELSDPAEKQIKGRSFKKK
jgi:hypothetical protein